MTDLKTLTSKIAIDPELTQVRHSMRQEDKETIADGHGTVFAKPSFRWGLVFVDNQNFIPSDSGCWIYNNSVTPVLQR